MTSMRIEGMSGDRLADLQRERLRLVGSLAQMVLSPLKEDPPAGIVIDLSQVSYFGSVFLSFLLRCHMLAKKTGCEVVLAGASERTRELLHAAFDLR